MQKTLEIENYGINPAANDLETALNGIDAIADIYEKLADFEQNNGLQYLSGWLREYRDDAYDAFIRIFKLGEYSEQAAARKKADLRAEVEGPGREHSMTAENHDPFAYGGDQRENGDAHILTLFREWRELLRLANDSREDDGGGLDEQVWTAMRRIYDTPASSPIGLTIKAYMALYEAFPDIGRSAISGSLKSIADSYSPDGHLQLQAHALRGWCQDAVRIVPELAPLVAEVVNVPTVQEQERLQKSELRQRADALVAEFDVPLPEGDFGLIEAERRVTEIRQRTQALYKEFEIDLSSEAEIINGIIDPVRDGYWSYIDETPPASLAGAAVKLRLLREGNEGLSEGEVGSGAITSIRQLAEFMEREASR